MATIEFISSTTIHATNNDDNSKHKVINLTPWDLKFLKWDHNQRGLLFHKPKTNQIQHLKQTLSSTLNFFPPLAGRLVITQHDEHNNVSCSIICNNAGALFIHATLENTTVSDILEPDYIPPVVHSFFPLNGVKNYEGTSHPLLAVQVTELIDGIFIGFTINHVVLDGKSFWHFVNSWAEISRGFNKPTNVPSFERFFPNNMNSPVLFPFTKETKNQQCGESPSHRIFHFTKEQILQLKSKANAEIDNSKIVISSLQALLSHFLRSTISKQYLKSYDVAVIVVPIDCRTKTCPKLKDYYFGNAVGADALVVMKAGELIESGIGKVGMEINKMISTHSHEKIMSEYESWIKTPNLIERGTPPSNMFVYVVASSPRTDFYGNDFGWGKPIAVRSGIDLINDQTGKVTVSGGAAEDGSIDLEVCLPRNILEALGNDHSFIDAIFA